LVRRLEKVVVCYSDRIDDGIDRKRLFVIVEFVVFRGKNWRK
jgi:hypothetical protein